MFKIAKLVFYVAIVAAIAFLYWFLPKYSYVHKNPGYCVNLTKNLYYCGTQAEMEKTFPK